MWTLIDNSIDIGATVIVVFSIAGASIWAAFKFFGQRWLEHQFSQRLEGLRHSNAIEIEKAKVDIGRASEGARSLQKYELEVLQIIWLSICDAYRAIAQLMQQLKFYPDIQKLSESEISDLCKSLGLDDALKIKILESENKMDQFITISDTHELNKAIEKFNSAQSIFLNKSILLEEQLSESIEVYISSLRGALTHMGLAIGDNDKKMKSQATREFKESGLSKLEELRSIIRDRIRSHGVLLKIEPE